MHNSGWAEFHFSTIHGNQGDEGGGGGNYGGDAGRGGIWNSGTLMLISSTVHGNTGGASGVGTNGASGMPAFGGGLWAEALSTNIIRHSTIAGNETLYADAVFSDGGRVEIDHALIGGAVAGDLFVAGPSLVENSDDAILDGNTGALISGRDPLLGELGFFGGATPVRRLKPMSPAVNAGDPAIADPPAWDQRGAPRIRGGRIDLGAYELQPAVSYVAGTGVDGTNECRDENQPCATLTHAIAQALPGDEIAVLPGVVTNDNLLLDRPLLIRGSGIGTSIWQGANNRLLLVPAGVTGTVRDLTLRGGRAPNGLGADDGESGGAIRNEGSLQILNCAFENNAAGAGGALGGAGGRGGAIYNNGILHVHLSVFAGNRSGQSGEDATGGSRGAIYNDAAAHIRDCSFIENDAGDGDPPAAGGFGGAV